MGFETEKFVGTVDDELICPICDLVLENPLQIIECQHVFCSDCITKWIQTGNQTCPLDRKIIQKEQLKTPRLVIKFLEKLQVKCDFTSQGCDSIVKLEHLSQHCKQCKFNPNNKTKCPQCGMSMGKEEFKNHNCDDEQLKLALEMSKYTFEIEKLQNLIAKLNERKSSDSVTFEGSKNAPFKSPTSTTSLQLSTSTNTTTSARFPFANLSSTATAPSLFQFPVKSSWNVTQSKFSNLSSSSISLAQESHTTSPKPSQLQPSAFTSPRFKLPVTDSTLTYTFKSTTQNALYQSGSIIPSSFQFGISTTTTSVQSLQPSTSSVAGTSSLQSQSTGYKLCTTNKTTGASLTPFLSNSFVPTTAPATTASFNFHLPIVTNSGLSSSTFGSNSCQPSTALNSFSFPSLGLGTTSDASSSTPYQFSSENMPSGSGISRIIKKARRRI